MRSGPGGHVSRGRVFRSLGAVVVACGFALGCVPGCTEPPTGEDGAGVRAELGVFYGGQVQQLRRVPWPDDGKRPTFGFRITFPEPLREAQVVRWEVDMPSRITPGQRMERVAEAKLEPGRVRLDQEVDVPVGARLGLWNVRVILGQRLVLDRAVTLFDPGSG